MSLDDVHRLARIAAQHLQGGRIDEGIAAYQALLALAPDRADDWFNLAYLQRAARRFEAALSSYGQALALGIDRPEEVHLNRAAILSDHLGRVDEAKQELGIAIAANPKFLLAWLNLAQLHEDEGASAEAQKAYGEALKLAPSNGRASARLAATHIFEKRPDRALALLDGALRRPGLTAEDAAELCFARGLALDALARYDEAFAAFGTANDMARSLLAPAARYQPAHETRAIAATIEAFGSADIRREKGGAGLIFICGMFRSGSTLAEQIIARHHGVSAGGELETLPALVGKLPDYPAGIGAMSQGELDDLAATYLAEIEALHPGATIITDKRPDNFRHIGLIKALFPEAKIVHTRRNLLDNILSIYFLHFAESVSYGFAMADIVHYSQSYQRLMAHWKTLFGDEIYDLDYDALVADPETEIRALLDYCGLDWDPACLGIGATAKAVRTASNWQVRQPLHARSSGRWANYARFLGPVRKALALP